MTMELSLLVMWTILTVVAADFYSARYDTFDIQPLLENDRILLSYTKCFLETGPCTPEAKDFRKVIPEALETSCGKCTPKQKELIRKVIGAIEERHPDCWKKLVDKYDPQMTYRASFTKFIKGVD